MGLADEGEENVLQKFEELCSDLNMDLATKCEAWENYQKILSNYSLEGDQLHWLACALYEACRRGSTPTIGRGVLEGNLVSLTRLLRSSKFSLIQFFNKMRKWSDMANLTKEFRDKIDKLERNFAVSTVIFKKFEPIFLDIFVNPAEVPRVQRGRKQRKCPCTTYEVFNLMWTMFVQVKGNFPAISDDLVNSYHLLLCCIDWFFMNAYIGGRKDLFNPDFSGLPDEYHNTNWKSTGEAPCIVELLCERHDGIVVEAKTIKEHWWKPHMKRLFEKKIIKGKVENLSGVLDLPNFEENMKSVNNRYEVFVLSVGDFDERIFLGECSNEEIGTPGGSSRGSDLAEQMAKRSLKQHFDETKSLAPSTPLTGQKYLQEKDQCITPVSTATQSVSKLQNLLSGTKTCPSRSLLEIFNQHCSKSPLDEIVKRVKSMGETFSRQYSKSIEFEPGKHMDFGRKRLQLGESLYYKILENVALSEMKRLCANGNENTIDLLALLEKDLFHRSLFACCLEIVIFSYNSQRTYPWIVEIFQLSSYHFYKVIEIIIRSEAGLSRDVVKHLNFIEETILESCAWKAESSLWDDIKENRIPICESVMPMSPNKHQRLHSAVGDIQRAEPQEKNSDPLLTPPGSFAIDRFSSPNPGSAKRRLFTAKPGYSILTNTPKSALASVLEGATRNDRNISLASQLKDGITDTAVLPPEMSSTLGSPSTSSSTHATKPSISIEGVAPEISSTEGSSTKTVSESGTHNIVAVMGNGKQIVIPIQVSQSSDSTAANMKVAGSLPTTSAKAKNLVKQGNANIVQVRVRLESKADADHNYNKPKTTGSQALFFRKVYQLASVRLRDLCKKLDLEDMELITKIWTCFEDALVNHPQLMCDRHIDQLLMCSIYLIAKVTENSLTFQNIMKCYRLQPQAHSHVYRSVLLTDRKRRHSGNSESSKSNEGSGSSSPNIDGKTTEDVNHEKKLGRSTSTLPHSQPGSQTPTPVDFAEHADLGVQEERGDLISFYNMVFLKKMRPFALKFSTQNHDQSNLPKLSTLPAVRSLSVAPRRISSTRPVYISPHQGSSPSNCTLSYCINSSPSKDLQAINEMIKQGVFKPATKRVLEVDKDEDSMPSPAKRSLSFLGNPIIKRLPEIIDFEPSD